MSHPLLVVVPFNISIRLNVPFPSDMRTMIKIHDHDISRRHPPASTQPVGTSIGDHQGVLYVHPFVPVAIPSPNNSSAREGQVPPIPPFKANPLFLYEVHRALEQVFTARVVA